LLSKDYVAIFLLVSHPLQYQHGYDDNRFMDKPYLPMIFFIGNKSLLVLLLKAPLLLLFDLTPLALSQNLH
jgi:hypothetical protein